MKIQDQRAVVRLAEKAVKCGLTAREQEIYSALRTQHQRELKELKSIKTAFDFAREEVAKK